MDRRDDLDHIRIFLSYAWSDGGDLVARLYDQLSEASPRFAPWYDRRGRPEMAFDRELQMQLHRSDVLILVLTRDVPHGEWVRDEIAYARKWNIKIIVAKMHDDVNDMISVIRLPPIDFTADREAAFAQLVEDLERIANADGVTDALGERIRAADAASDPRHHAFAEESRDRLEEEQVRAADPGAARRRTQERVRSGMRQEHESKPAARPGGGMRLINEMPEVAQTHKFYDRLPMLRQIEQALSAPNVRIVLLVGDGGNGKTALVGEVRQRLADGEFRASAAGFIYLAVGGYRGVTATTLLDDLGRLIPDTASQTRVRRRLRERLSLRVKLDEILAALGITSAVVAIDNLDDLLDEDGGLRDAELDAVVRTLVWRRDHGIRLLLIARRQPRALVREHRPYVRSCTLDEGLPDIRPFFEELDTTRVLDLASVRDADIVRLNLISAGKPRFIELVYCLMRSDPDMTVESVCAAIAPEGTETTPPEAMTALLQLIMSRLDRTQRRVVQGLAVFGRPVRPDAVDFLLEKYVVGIDSAPILRRLAEWRLIRRDGDRYFLPPDPDTKQIRETIPPGDKEDFKSLHDLFTRPFLLHRAAGYFGEVGRRPDVTINRLADLQPLFNEIDLLITGGGYRPAVKRMAEIDVKYLTRWGQSAVLVPWRLMVRGKLGSERLEAHNLSFLIAARYGDEDYSEWAEVRLVEAMGQRWARSGGRDRLRLRVQLADVQQDGGKLTSAAGHYRTTALRFLLRRMRYEEAWSRTSLGLCLARLGRFAQAERELAKAGRISATLEDQQRAEIATITLLNQGWLYGQLGKIQQALETLDKGMEAARDMASLRLQGRLLDGRAALLCDCGKADEAVPLARRAADIGVRTRHPALAREAYVTLALAYLHSGDLDNAETAAQAAVEHPPGIRALGAWATYGLVLFRKDERGSARTAFHRACTEAWLRLDREPGEYVALDAAGLALCGLQLCEEPNRIQPAVEAYRKARRLAPDADGARRRAVSQLGLFGDRAAQDILDTARRAAETAASAE